MRRSTVLATLTVLAAPVAASSQNSVLVDQGSFTITVNGVEVGREEFQIRRRGLLSNASFIADGSVTIREDGSESRFRSILGANAPVGAVQGYQLTVTGASPLEVTFRPAGPRFASTFVSADGLEEREFRARPDTRIVESFVAHHYYFLFLRELREGDALPVICPRLRTESRYQVVSVDEDELTLGVNTVPARRVIFSVDGQHRSVWFDRQGRVLKVEVPADGYVAVRQDLVG